jgi:hypothetical protein
MIFEFLDEIDANLRDAVGVAVRSELLILSIISDVLIQPRRRPLDIVSDHQPRQGTLSADRLRRNGSRAGRSDHPQTTHGASSILVPLHASILNPNSPDGHDDNASGDMPNIVTRMIPRTKHTKITLAAKIPMIARCLQVMFIFRFRVSLRRGYSVGLGSLRCHSHRETSINAALTHIYPALVGQAFTI